MHSPTEIAIGRPSTVEWPTVLLIAATYGGLTVLMLNFHALPWWIVAPLAGYLIALHGSLQHEILHGHPTRSRTLNELLVFINPGIWFPYRRYRKLHLIHHNDDNLTDPQLDPESYYLLPEDWSRLSPAIQLVYTINNTLAGRMVLGPIIGTVRFWSAEFREILRGNREIIKAWSLHAVSVAIVLGFAVFVCNIALWQYLLLFAWPGIGLSLIRSFCEHQAVHDLGERTIIVESSAPLSLMFLNNNLHVAHHTRPQLAWYRIPAYYRAEREALIARNHGYLMHGYREIFRRYFVTPKEPVVYPRPEWLRKP